MMKHHKERKKDKVMQEIVRHHGMDQLRREERKKRAPTDRAKELVKAQGTNK